MLARGKSLLEGTQVGAYRILGRIGAGGMGEVWMAEHAMLGRRAAIKFLHPQYSHDAQIVGRFFNEARAATAISDPGIVQIFDFGHHDDGSAYIVMELLEGEPLDRRLRTSGALAIGDVVRLMRQVATSIGAAHARGIIHRDLKPENLFLVRDPEVPGGERVKILDFGIAKLGAGHGGLKTQTAAMLGTPAFMSPEQCRGAGEVDQRSDVYALGCVLFTLVTGRPPFVGDGAGEIIAMHLREPAPRASTIMRGLPRELDNAIARCLEKAPERRFASAAELASALAASVPAMATVLLTAPQAASKSMPTTLSSLALEIPQKSRHRSWVFGGTMIVAVVSAITISFVVRGSRSSNESRTQAPPPASASVIAAAPPVDAAEDKLATTASHISKLLAGFSTWANAHAGAPCPDVAQLGEADDIADAWGHTMTITCTVQPDDQMVGVISAGEDGILSTSDDVVSWRLGGDNASLVRGARWGSTASSKPTANATLAPRPVTRRPRPEMPTSGLMDNDGIPNTR